MPNPVEHTNQTISWSWDWILRRNFIRRLHHFFQQLFEIRQAGGGNDDGVAPSADILGDAQEPSARIFLEREDKGFALNLQLLGLERVFV